MRQDFGSAGDTGDSTCKLPVKRKRIAA